MLADDVLHESACKQVGVNNNVQKRLNMERSWNDGLGHERCLYALLIYCLQYEPIFKLRPFGRELVSRRLNVMPSYPSK